MCCGRVPIPHYVVTAYSTHCDHCVAAVNVQTKTVLCCEPENQTLSFSLSMEAVMLVAIGTVDLTFFTLKSYDNLRVVNTHKVHACCHFSGSGAGRWGRHPQSHVHGSDWLSCFSKQSLMSTTKSELWTVIQRSGTRLCMFYQRFNTIFVFQDCSGAF